MAAAGRVTFLGLRTYHLHTYLSAGNMGAASKIMCRSMITPLRRRLHAAPTSRADEEADKPSSGRKLKSLPPNGRRTNPGERTPSTPGQRAAKRTSARGRRSNPGEGTPSTPSERAAKRTQASDRQNDPTRARAERTRANGRQTTPRGAHAERTRANGRRTRAESEHPSARTTRRTQMARRDDDRFLHLGARVSTVAPARTLRGRAFR
jgi:hypothetical protein